MVLPGQRTQAMTHPDQAVRDRLTKDGQPKRILALDGGGLRGIVTLGILKEVEKTLRAKHDDDPKFVLGDYFDLIAGTSTGAIIAAGLAQGMSIAELTNHYMDLGEKVFQKSFFRRGALRTMYSAKDLIKELKKVFGKDTTLGFGGTSTGLLIVAKRLDTGSAWPVSNNPFGEYYDDRPSGSIGNGKYQLWQIVRASTAAPAFFEPEAITISEGVPGRKDVKGEFVDGGVSPHNNPALQALMYATLDGYNIEWDTGKDKILLVSVGTGLPDPSVDHARLTAHHAINSLKALMDDAAQLNETLLQWMSDSPTARKIDSELGTLGQDLIAGEPLMTYLRYNVVWSEDYLTNKLGMIMQEDEPESLCAMDDPDKMGRLQEAGLIAGRQQVISDHFPDVFNQPTALGD